jgi:hypothetical protein
MLGDAESAFTDGKMVFHGEVLAVSEDRENWQKSVAFAIDTVWHGPAVNGMVIQTGLDSAMCGMNFEVGKEYTVVANSNEGQWWAQLCGQHYADPETGEGIGPEQLVADREPLVMNEDLSCVPHVCQDGSMHPACTQDGSQINYFAEPCHMSGGPIEEEPENEEIPGAIGGDFTDVPETHASFEAIMWARQNGIVEGYADGTFRPKALVNRAEFTKILIEAYGINTVALCRMAEFPDAPMQQWYGPYVHAARCQGVISGYPDGTFRPSANINYAEAAKIIANLDSEAELDVKDGAMWYLPYTDYIKEHGAIVSSIRDVGQYITRAEMVELMYKLLAKPISEGETSLTGRIERIERPAEDIAYDFVLVLDTPMRDPLSAMGPWAMVEKVVLVYTNEILFEDFDDYVGARVTVEGQMQWGYAESRVFAVEAIAVE